MRCEIRRASGREVTQDDVPGYDLELDIAENGTVRFFFEHESPVDCIAISRATGCKITSEWLDGITIEDYSVAEDIAKELNWWVRELNPRVSELCRCGFCGATAAGIHFDGCNYAAHLGAALSLISKAEGR